MESRYRASQRLELWSRMYMLAHASTACDKEAVACACAAIARSSG
jgi:hypothetical protein